MTLQEFKEIFKSIQDTYQFSLMNVSYDTRKLFRCKKYIDNKTRCMCPITAVYHYKFGLIESERTAFLLGVALGLSGLEIKMILSVSDLLINTDPYYFFDMMERRPCTLIPTT